MRTCLALAALGMIAAACLPAKARADDDALVYVTMHYISRAQLQSIASRFQHLAIDEKTHSIGLEATHDELIALRRDGIDATIDDAATRRLRQAEAYWSGTRADSTLISGFPCYRTVTETFATMDQLAQSHPTLAQVVDIGPSWLENRAPGTGHRMRALELTNRATGFDDKPALVVFASIHAREYTPAELLTRFAEGLVEGYGTDAEATWLLDNFRFHLILQANPDGRVKAEDGLSWRKNVDNSNGSCSATNYGVDLNRNFPFQWHQAPGGSSGNACASTYRGPSSVSEAETQELLRYVAGIPDGSGTYHGGVLPDLRDDAVDDPAPDDYRGMFLDLHSAARTVMWPWSYAAAPSPNASALRTLGRRLAWYNGYKPEQWIAMYAADGTDTDAMYGLLGVPSYTIEMGVAFFESCSTFEQTTLPKNLAALRFAARNLWAPYAYPAGPTTTALVVSPTSVVAGTPVNVRATINDARFSMRNGTEAVQTIKSAAAFVDQAPWATNAMPHAMSANDGGFDETSEPANLRLSTTGLAPGRHVVFVQGTDASGAAGTPQAVYFDLQ
ncbi:MAG: M14 family zinc carboxypeptidase [Luteimonas sp.]